MAKNEITGDEIKSRIPNKKYRDGYDNIDWGRDPTIDKAKPEELWKRERKIIDKSRK